MRTLTGHRDGRLAARQSVLMTAKLRRYGSSHRFEVRVRDLSMTGFQAETVFDLHVGNSLALIIDGFAPLDATVMWADRDRYGCAFNRALHVAVFEHIVRLQPRG